MTMLIHSPCCPGSNLVKTELRAGPVLRCGACKRDYGLLDARGSTVDLRKVPDAVLPQARYRF